MDNARIHHEDTVKKFIVLKKMPILYSGIFSCDSAPAEILFSIAKRDYKKRCGQIIEEAKRACDLNHCRILTQR